MGGFAKDREQLIQREEARVLTRLRWQHDQRDHSCEFNGLFVEVV